MSPESYRGRSVLVTGVTGFKGAWLAAWLTKLGARVTGFSLRPPTDPSLFDTTALAGRIRYHEGDVRDAGALTRAFYEAEPEIVFHLAAQSLVRVSYEAPVETFSTNVLGTVQLLETIRLTGRPSSVVVVTSDKCYENQERDEPYREGDVLGGFDPYSASKGCAEIVVDSYRRSFFPPRELSRHGVALASARAGNVIGAGDWARDRLVPDCVAALTAGRPIAVRNPRSVRPWQHVLESLSGYLTLGARLVDRDANACGPFNFGPSTDDACTVAEMVESLVAAWGSGSWQEHSSGEAVHEAKLLRLDVTKAKAVLDWTPTWRVRDAIGHTVAGYRELVGAGADDAWRIIGEQIAAYEAHAAKSKVDAS